MRIDHIAIWTKDLEKTKEFYMKYFDMDCNNKYVNPKKQFSSYFLSFKQASCRIELMHNPEIAESLQNYPKTLGLTHFAISLGSKELVDQLTDHIRKDGYQIIGEPRTTGDGYYESVIEDCEGNHVEITA
ncbi:VOC family protein [Marinifilum caeruleilacunae]|uniref:Glyoxalase/bleomycin resistance/extradiol dioxygenase family protein n=1 Tax=Marinifilum caeruleilacunae TaxID=2499076 RepID=A0ABX1WQS3_9BACT|nr:VOC family protein [Marinifilum caeruleilacunae]NOU58436.1 glyoxalase/bleomycin resistance/extradiol dioxygenase family protein [Marinifilum caeruleilacunae]